MIWVILVAIGVPLWLCALAILLIVFRNRALRKRLGDIPVRLRTEPGKRWTRGHSVWVHDVFAFRGSPAAWKESLFWVTSASATDATGDEAHDLRRLDAHPVIARLEVAGHGFVDVAVKADHRTVILGPYALDAAASRTETLQGAQNGASISG